MELLAVVTILGILAVVIIPRIGGDTRIAKINMCNQYKGDLNGALEKYYFDMAVWATDTSSIANNDSYFPTAVPVCPYDGTAYTIDSTTHRIQGHNH